MAENDGNNVAIVESPAKSESPLSSREEFGRIQKELAKELKAKDGLERFLSLASGNLLNPRAYTPDLMEYSRELYEESKAKTTFLRMQLERYFWLLFWFLGHLFKMWLHCFFQIRGNFSI
ncbi:unnamed protein product [Meloidogyne enterolobii]|uniref:Uncharacterized protein n=1 Tax=Meloidogyne enterolobii TaxID=390850 RepID=A0ACB0Z337_MELEN